MLRTLPEFVRIRLSLYSLPPAKRSYDLERLQPYSRYRLCVITQKYKLAGIPPNDHVWGLVFSANLEIAGPHGLSIE